MLCVDFKFVCSYHGRYHAPTISRIPFGFVFDGALHYIYRHYASGIVVVANHSKKYLVSKHISDNKIITIHNGLKQRSQNNTSILRKDLGLKDSDFVIAVVSRLEPVKGIKYFISAFSEVLKIHPQCHLIIVGSGSSESLLKKQCENLNIENSVKFLGHQNNIDPLYDLFDVFALPSLSECHSIGLLEAMRAKKAIVATDVGGNPESVVDGKQAILVPPANAEALKIALMQLIENKELRINLAEAAYIHFQNEFTEERMLQKTAEWLLSFQKTN